MRFPHRLQDQKVKSQGHGAGAYCGGHLAAQLVYREKSLLDRLLVDYIFRLHSRSNVWNVHTVYDAWFLCDMARVDGLRLWSVPHPDENGPNYRPRGLKKLI